MITGTISNAVRQDFLSKKFEAKKKSGNRTGHPNSP